MQCPDLSPSEWKYVAHCLVAICAKLPKTGKFSLGYNATSWDFDDLYREARTVALYSRSGVLKIVEEYKSRGAWPRGQYEAKFWLKARSETASAFALECAEEAIALASPENRTTASREAIKALVYDMWDEQLVDEWLRENLGDYTFLDYYGLDPERIVEYNKWIDELENGRYLKNK